MMPTRRSRANYPLCIRRCMSDSCVLETCRCFKVRLTPAAQRQTAALRSIVNQLRSAHRQRNRPEHKALHCPRFRRSAKAATPEMYSTRTED